MDFYAGSIWTAGESSMLKAFRPGSSIISFALGEGMEARYLDSSCGLAAASETAVCVV